MKSLQKRVRGPVAIGWIFSAFLMVGTILSKDAFTHEDDAAEDQHLAYFYYLLGSLSSLNNEPKTALEYFQAAANIDPDVHELHLRQAEELLNLNLTQQAKTVLEQLSSEAHKNAEFYMLMARVSSQEGNLNESVKSLEKASQLYFAEKRISKARETLLTKVALLADHKRYHEAIEALNRYIKQQPDDEVAYYFLGKIYAIFQQRDKAKVAFERALQLRPNFGAAAKALGLHYELEGKIPEAIAVYQKALRSSVNDDELLQKLINLSLIQDDYKNALEYLKQSLASDSTNVQNQMRAALILYKLENFEEAEKMFQDILKAEDAPRDRVLYYLGSLNEERKNFPRAIEFLEKIKSNSEYFVEARVSMANILSTEMKKDDVAIHSLTEALQLKADSPDLVLALATQYERKNMLVEGIRVLSKANETIQDNERILFMLGSLLDRAGDFEAGIAKMRKVLQINPNNPHALNHIGYSYAERKINLEEAEALLKKAVQLAPDNGFILDSLAWVYYQRDEFTKSQKLLERANTMTPNQPVILEHLADVYRKNGKQQQALEAYRKAMRFSVQNLDRSDGKLLSPSSVAEFEGVRNRVRGKISALDPTAVSAKPE